jgi:hypothetical protein
MKPFSFQISQEEVRNYINFYHGRRRKGLLGQDIDHHSELSMKVKGE